MGNNLLSVFDSFNNKHNLIGFSDFFDDLWDFSSNIKEASFPPYNIFTIEDENGELKTFIQLACAGYSKDMLTITYNTKTNVLTVKGSNTNDETTLKKYHYKGIASRDFENSWKMSDSLELVKSSMDNGILTIEFKEKKKREELKMIEIE